MRALPLGWATDLAVLEYTGSAIRDHGDHIVVRTPQNPDFHWGNCLFVTDPDAVDAADRWVETFHEAVPGADWVAIGLTRLPTRAQDWKRHQLELEVTDVLGTAALPTAEPDSTSWFRACRPNARRARDASLACP